MTVEKNILMIFMQFFYGPMHNNVSWAYFVLMCHFGANNLRLFKQYVVIVMFVVV